MAKVDQVLAAAATARDSVGQLKQEIATLKIEAQSLKDTLANSATPEQLDQILAKVNEIA